MDSLNSKLQKIIQHIKMLRKSNDIVASTTPITEDQVVFEELCKTLPNGQWVLEKNIKPQIKPPQQPVSSQPQQQQTMQPKLQPATPQPQQATTRPRPQSTQRLGSNYDNYLRQQMKEKAMDEFKNRMRDVINFYHRKKKPIESRHILLDEDAPYHHRLISNKERLNIFQDIAREQGLHHEYPITYNHSPSIDEREFGLPKGERVKIEIPKQNKVKLVTPAAGSKEGARPESGESWRMGYGGYLLPKRHRLEISDPVPENANQPQPKKK